jgi:biopolymer transport protein ExbD/biopolymer transport protein TolR
MDPTFTLEAEHSTRKAANRRRHRRGRVAHGVGSASLKSEINVTPFVDVVLVLLIIFMVVTPMLQRGVDVPLPFSLHHGEKKDTGEQIIVSVRRDGAIFLGSDSVDLKRLENRLTALLSRKPPPPIFIKADRRMTFKTVRLVLEVCHRAGAPGVSLATRSAKEES